MARARRFKLGESTGLTPSAPIGWTVPALRDVQRATEMPWRVRCGATSRLPHTRSLDLAILRDRSPCTVGLLRVGQAGEVDPTSGAIFDPLGRTCYTPFCTSRLHTSDAPASYPVKIGRAHV